MLNFTCIRCKKAYKYKKSFDKHLINCKIFSSSSDFSSFSDSWAQIFHFDDEYWNEEIIDSTLYSTALQDSETYLESLNRFCNNNNKNLKVLHLNINSIFSKIDSFYDILDRCKYDILFINESKLNLSIPDSKISHKNYTLYRRDRDFGYFNNRSGGILLYIKKEFIHSVKICDKFESMHLNLLLKNTTYNFLASY